MYFSYQERKMFDMNKQKRIYVTGINVLKMIFISLIYYFIEWLYYYYLKIFWCNMMWFEYQNDKFKIKFDTLQRSSTIIDRSHIYKICHHMYQKPHSFESNKFPIRFPFIFLFDYMVNWTTRSLKVRSGND